MLVGLQKIIPQHGLSRLLGFLANCRAGFITRFAIRLYIKCYQVNMQEAQEPDYKKYQSFNDFFTRAIAPAARPLTNDQNALLCPVDGCISELGKIQRKKLLQAKGVDYDLTALLGGSEALSEWFVDGEFMTIYLSPRDYHRIHMPITGKLTQMIHVPGKLFSVNPYTVNNVPQLFARNERVINLFDTDIGPVAMIAVGAVIVGSVATTWHGVVTPPTAKTIQCWDYAEQNIFLKRADEMGRFLLGSTVIMLFPKNTIHFDERLQANVPVKFGERLGEVVTN